MMTIMIYFPGILLDTIENLEGEAFVGNNGGIFNADVDEDGRVGTVAGDGLRALGIAEDEAIFMSMEKKKGLRLQTRMEKEKLSEK